MSAPGREFLTIVIERGESAWSANVFETSSGGRPVGNSGFCLTRWGAVWAAYRDFRRRQRRRFEA